MTVEVSVNGITNDEAAAIGYLLYPYKVELSRKIDSSDVIISRDALRDTSKPIIRIRGPSEHGDLRLRDCGNGIVDLPSDLITASAKSFRMLMSPRIAFIYSLATRLPFAYNNIPFSIRKRLLMMHTVDPNLSNHLANERTRKILIEAFGLLRFHLERKNPPRLLITHDIETERGLERALLLKSVEDKLDVHSTWFLPSNEYPIAKRVAKSLADGSAIGSHDIRHDGRIIHIRRHDELVERLSSSRTKLEGIFEKKVECFRSPLLQFSETIVAALRESGYRFDFSVPCWEPVHPVRMTGFGVEALQSFEIHGIVESPLTLLQDHQVFTVLGMSTHEAVKYWIEQATLVRALDGDIVLLIHPDYAFSGDLARYEILLKSLLEAQETVCPSAS
jgi:peptidoglycan/xylan/chitin deacetylase (PgdA/CDA1 family)